MTHWRLGNRAEGYYYYIKFAEHIEKNARDEEDLRRFLAEAADLMGVADLIERGYRVERKNRSIADKASPVIQLIGKLVDHGFGCLHIGQIAADGLRKRQLFGQSGGLCFGLRIVDHNMPAGCGKAPRYFGADPLCSTCNEHCWPRHRLPDKVN